MRRTTFLLAASLLFLCSVDPANAGIFNTGVPFNVNVTNDPLGNNSTVNSVPLNGGPTLIDGGLLSVTEAITPLSPDAAIIQFTITTPNLAPLAGNPGAFWEVQISGFETNGLAALNGPFYETFVDANGNSVPTVFPGYSLAPNPTDPTQTVAEINATNTPRVVHFDSLALGLFDQAPASYENGGIVPTTFVLGAEYQVSTPEPAGLTLACIGAVSVALGAWRKRHRHEA